MTVDVQQWARFDKTGPLYALRYFEVIVNVMLVQPISTMVESYRDRWRYEGIDSSGINILQSALKKHSLRLKPF